MYIDFKLRHHANVSRPSFCGTTEIIPEYAGQGRANVNPNIELSALS